MESANHSMMRYGINPSTKGKSENVVSIRQDRRLPKSVSQVYEALTALSTLEDNWDTYGAARPNQGALLGTMQWASDLFNEQTPTPHVFPIPNGNIQLEWSQNGMDIELEIVSISTCVAYCHDTHTGREWENTFTFDITKLTGIIQELTDRHLKNSLTMTAIQQY